MKEWSKGKKQQKLYPDNTPLEEDIDHYLIIIIAEHESRSGCRPSSLRMRRFGKLDKE